MKEREKNGERAYLLEGSSARFATDGQQPNTNWASPTSVVAFRKALHGGFIRPIARNHRL